MNKVILGTFLALTFSACVKIPKAPVVMNTFSKVKSGVALIHPIKGGKVTGVVKFVPNTDGIKVLARIEGLKPNAKHGFHIHEFGDCSALDFTSAGPHYNPEGRQHSGPENKERHAGDMGNLTANTKGVAEYEYDFSKLTVARGENPVLGRAVIVHESEDNLVSQPTGNAGARIACGVIGIAQY
jgi:superoxide dismutase, Cu-Zn family